jgi:hypothetical protein
MKTLDEAIDWLVAADNITTAQIWVAASMARCSAKAIVDELLKRKIIDYSSAKFVQRMSGTGYETVYD